MRTGCTKTETQTFNVKFYGLEACVLCGMTKIMCLPKYNFRVAGFVKRNLEGSLETNKLLLLLCLLSQAYSSW